MAEKEKGRGSPAERPEPAPGHEAVDVAFDDIIDAILEANTEAVKGHQQQRRRQRRASR
jgi:hypothetical protein